MINEQSIINDKDDRQDLGLHRFITSGYNGILNYVPRFGKTRVGIKCAVKAAEHNDNQKVLIVVMNDMQVKQWYNAINVYNVVCLYEDQLTDFKVTTIAKLSLHHTEVNIEYGCIIYDEIHKYITVNRLDVLNSKYVTSKSKVGLTGTMPDNHYPITTIIPVIDIITEDEAIMQGWISNYVEYNYGINFNSIEEKQYLMYSELINTVSANFRGLGMVVGRTPITREINNVNISFYVKLNDYKLIIAAAKGYYDIVLKQYINADAVCKIIAAVKGYHRNLDPNNAYDKMILDNWSPTAISTFTNKFKVYVENRNMLMTNSLNKMYATIDVISQYKDKTIILFMGSTKAADVITEIINNKFGSNYAACYHSKIKSRYLKDASGKHITFGNGNPKKFGKTGLLKHAIRGITDGTIKILVTVNALDEGLNLPNINLAITTFGTNNPIQHIQRTARAKTINPDNVTEKVTIVNIYFDSFVVNDTEIKSKDKVKLLNRQNGSNSRIINITNLTTLLIS